MQTASEEPTVTRAPSKWRALVAGAATCAVVLAVAYAVIVTYRDHRWSMAAQQQAQDFVYASPVLSRDIGAVTAVRNTSEVHAKRTPPTYDVDFHVTGQKGDGTVEVVLTRHGPSEWLVSSAKLERGGHQSVGLL
jgi:hypothetical protein